MPAAARPARRPATAAAPAAPTRTTSSKPKWSTRRSNPKQSAGRRPLRQAPSRFSGEQQPMGRRRADGYVMISIISERYNIHPQTLPLYEREELIKPTRTSGNTRLYGLDEIRKL